MVETNLPNAGAFTREDLDDVNAVLNKLAITAGKVLTVSNSLIFAGTDATTMTFPTTSATIARTDAANTFTGTQAFGLVSATGIAGLTPVAAGATLTVTVAMAMTTILLNTAAGSVATLPAATGTGNTYRFLVSVSTTSNAHKILAASSSDFLVGNAWGYTGSTAKVFGSAAATNHSIQMPFSGSQPSGGIIGDTILVSDIGANLWHVDMEYQAGTTPTTPFSSSTS